MFPFITSERKLCVHVTEIVIVIQTRLKTAVLAVRASHTYETVQHLSLKLKLNLFNNDTRRKWLLDLPNHGLMLKAFDDY